MPCDRCNPHTFAMQLEETRDKAAIERELAGDPIRALYHLGDLDDHYFKKCRWFFISDGGNVVTVVLLYESWGVALLPLGDYIGLQFFIDEYGSNLPDRFYGTWMPEHDDVFSRCYSIPNKQRMYRMVLTRDQFSPQPPDNRVARLDESHSDGVRTLLESYPENFFEEYQLSTGFYRGILDGGKVLSMAGVHTTNRERKVAAIGNIVTSEACRGRGLATAVTSTLVTDLLVDHDLVGLNVNRENLAAIHVYERLGFRVGVEFFEGFCHKRS